MLKKLFSVLGFLVIIVAMGAISRTAKVGVKGAFSSSKPNQQEIEAQLIEGLKTAANQINQKLPMMLDKETRADKATVGPGMRLVYHHTFPRYTANEIDSNWLHTSLRSEVMRRVCASADMKKSLQYGGIYVYSYSGNDNVEITRFEITRNDCGFPKISP